MTMIVAMKPTIFVFLFLLTHSLYAAEPQTTAIDKYILVDLEPLWLKRVSSDELLQKAKGIAIQFQQKGSLSVEFCSQVAIDWDPKFNDKRELYRQLILGAFLVVDSDIIEVRIRDLSWFDDKWLNAIVSTHAISQLYLTDVPHVSSSGVQSTLNKLSTIGFLSICRCNNIDVSKLQVEDTIIYIDGADAANSQNVR